MNRIIPPSFRSQKFLVFVFCFLHLSLSLSVVGRCLCCCLLSFVVSVLFWFAFHFLLLLSPLSFVVFCLFIFFAFHCLRLSLSSFSVFLCYDDGDHWLWWQWCLLTWKVSTRWFRRHANSLPRASLPSVLGGPFDDFVHFRQLARDSVLTSLFWSMMYSWTHQADLETSNMDQTCVQHFQESWISFQKWTRQYLFSKLDQNLLSNLNQQFRLVCVKA